METVDTVVIGAGVVGLAAARSLALAGREVLVLEAADGIGTETSSRNSEVIHAGIYYPKGSLKASLCVAGKEALYAYCAERGITARPLGKLIVAIDAEQTVTLASIRAAAAANGVTDLRWIDAPELERLEPSVRGVAALLSPSSGIIDSHALMLSLQGDLENNGGMVVLTSPLGGGEVTEDGIRLWVGGAEPIELLARRVVNAAGLWATAIAERLDGFPKNRIPPAYFARGVYFGLAGLRPPFRRLIYPIPEPGGLGIHATIDLGGQVRFGPDVEWIERPSYEVDPGRATRFYAAIRTYWPGLPDGALEPAYAGVRPKVTGPGEPAGDFIIQGPRQHRCRGLVNLFGIESPGLTASLAIGDYVAALLQDEPA
ncbi:MAG TPA: NAD(P)/FAD-dependent oxidoreductase [Beijerinckiaceae bacterium]|nr:NAD(P)/FAD-dependent oxidoreductase [Beijerinckiaceae bacterium]